MVRKRLLAPFTEKTVLSLESILSAMTHNSMEKKLFGRVTRHFQQIIAAFSISTTATRGSCEILQQH